MNRPSVILSVIGQDPPGARDASAFDRLYARHHAGLYRFLYRLAGSRDHADDLFQETWLRMARCWSSLEAVADVEAWLFTVARNVFMSSRRAGASERRGVERLRVLPEGRAAPADRALESHERAAALERAWAALDDDDRVLLWLVAVEELGQHQIAQVLGLGHAAVRQRVTRARARLAARLAEPPDSVVPLPRSHP
jgi:RNA polymerase sigma-70 factor, ECF subfamily